MFYYMKPKLNQAAKIDWPDLAFQVIHTYVVTTSTNEDILTCLWQVPQNDKRETYDKLEKRASSNKAIHPEYPPGLD